MCLLLTEKSFPGPRKPSLEGHRMTARGSVPSPCAGVGLSPNHPAQTPPPPGRVLARQALESRKARRWEERLWASGRQPHAPRGANCHGLGLSPVRSPVTRGGGSTASPQQRRGGAGTPGRRADRFPQDSGALQSVSPDGSAQSAENSIALPFWLSLAEPAAFSTFSAERTGQPGREN